jgi:hypothetical protein
MATRFAGGLMMVFAAAVITGLTWKQPRAGMLALVWSFSLVFLSFHWLVEPRYYIIPFLLLGLFTELSAGQARRMTIWYGLLSLLAVVGTLRGFYI